MRNYREAKGESMPFEFQPLSLPGLVLIKPKVFTDPRGFFLETYKESDFVNYGISLRFVQVNHSRSKRGVLRGLHYQLHPKAQGKLVLCVRGRVWDVAVDIRLGSPTFKKWIAVELSEENHHMLWIPPGFAHGFVALEDADIIYKVTAEYDPALDRGIRWDDPEIAIAWPLKDPILSEKDARLPSLNEAEINFIYGENS